MSDPDLATRAPESDAAAQSVFPNDSEAQTGPTLGEHCVTDRPAPAGKPTGEMSKFGDIIVYISKPNDYPHSPSRLLLFLTGGTGVGSVNNQLQADKFASEGYVVVMPDLFGGDAAPNSTTNPDTSEGSSLIEQIKLRAAETAKSFMIDMWLARHTADKVMPILHNVLNSAKDEYADAVANGGGIYAAGFCFGGRYVLLLAGQHADTVTSEQAQHDEEQGAIEQGPFIKAGALAHATLVAAEDFDGLKAPVSLACVERDQLFDESILEEGRKYLVSKNIEHEIKVYPDVPHGFAVLGEYDDPKIKEAQNFAYEQMLSWLNSH